MPIRPIALADIDLDGSPHTRFKLIQEVVDDYSEIVNQKDCKMPAILLWKSQKSPFYYVADGLHRIAAARKAGMKSVLAQVTEGTWADCLRQACGCNVTHGLRRSVEDKRCLIETVLMNGGAKMANSAIAQLTHVSVPTIEKIRKMLEEHNTIPPEPVRVNNEGKKKNVRGYKPQKDSTGVEIPEPLQGLWDRRDEVSKLLRIIEGVRRDLFLAYSMEDRLYAEVDFNAAAADLQKLMVNVKLAVPYALCTQCQGRLEVQPDQKCPMCKGRGMISEWRYKNCAPEEIKAIRETVNKETE